MINKYDRKKMVKMKINLIIEFKAWCLELSENKTDNNFGKKIVLSHYLKP